MTTHKFKVRIGKEILTYDRYEDIPETFDNMILFAPKIPQGPHTDEQHAEIDIWMERFVDLLKRETK
jgi:hypothetical protein